MPAVFASLVCLILGRSSVKSARFTLVIFGGFINFKVRKIFHVLRWQGKITYFQSAIFALLVLALDKVFLQISLEKRPELAQVIGLILSKTT